MACELFYYNKVAEATRESLPTAEWEQAWQEGMAMTLEQAIAYAVEE